MKRFTDTCKWDDPWFRALTGVQKLIFMYVIDRCNNAGFWERDDAAMAFHTTLKPELIEGAWKGLDRGLKSVDGWVWVRRFLRHQKNENLSADNPAHKQIVVLLAEQIQRFGGVVEFAEFVAPYKGLLSPCTGGIGKCTGTGQVREKGMQGEKPNRGTADEIAAFVLELSLKKSDAEWFFNKCEANGWTNDGRPIKDWKATLRSWKAAGYIPSQKATTANGTPKLPGHR